jgi:hypothetical protein
MKLYDKIDIKEIRTGSSCTFKTITRKCTSLIFVYFFYSRRNNYETKREIER